MIEADKQHKSSKSHDSLGQQAVSSAAVLGLKRVVLQLVITGSNIILARILFPEVFGVFTITSFIIGLFGFGVDLGFGAAIVQKKDEPSKEQLKVIFTLQLFLGILCSLLLWVLTPVVLSFYKSQIPQGTGEMLKIYSLALIFSAPGYLPRALLERRLKYKRFVLGEIAALILSKTVAIILALGGLGIAALVYAELVSRLVASVAYLLLSGFSLGFSFALRKLSSLVKFSLSFQVSTLMGFLNGAVIPFYIGAFPGPGGWTGSQAVGYVSFASGLGSFARFFSEIIGQLMFPVVSRAQADSGKVRKSIERAIGMAAFLSFGLIAILLALSGEIIYFIYTERWLPAVPLLNLLFLQAAALSISLILFNTFLALGKSRIYFWLRMMETILQWVLTIPLVKIYGFVGFGWASVVVSVSSLLISFLLLRRSIKFSFWREFIGEIAACLATLALLLIVKEYLVIDTIWRLIICGTLGGGMYLLVIFVLRSAKLAANFVYIFRLINKRNR